MQGMPKWGVDISKAPPPVQASLEPIVRFFSWHDAHPVAMTMVLLEKFGPDWIVWEPETLKSEIITTFRATSISDQNWQKLQAVRVLMQTEGFWKEWHIFEKVVQALNNNIPLFDLGQRCTIAQLMAGVDIAHQLHVEKFDDEVKKYTAACAIDDGVTYLPDPLDYAKDYLAVPMYECQDCGSIARDDTPDGRCDFCTGRFTKLYNLNGRPQEGLADSVGRNIKHYLTRDPAPAQKKFEELKAGNRGDLSDESPEDVQAVKLMVGYNYMLQRRKELSQQLEELKSWISH
jgi:rubrerythrin